MKVKSSVTDIYIFLARMKTTVLLGMSRGAVSSLLSSGMRRNRSLHQRLFSYIDDNALIIFTPWSTGQEVDTKVKGSIHFCEPVSVANSWQNFLEEKFYPWGKSMPCFLCHLHFIWQFFSVKKFKISRIWFWHWYFFVVSFWSNYIKKLFR